MDYKTLLQIVKNAEYEPRSYSGRGMYGKSCFGFSVSTLAGAVSDVMFAAYSYGETVMEDLKDLFNKSNFDSLGKGYIIYFENMPWRDLRPENEEDDCCANCNEPMEKVNDIYECHNEFCFERTF